MKLLSRHRHGMIELNELQKALEIKNIKADGSGISNEDVRIVFEAMDTDRSGKIDYGEFLGFMNNPDQFAKRRRLQHQKQRIRLKGRERAPNFVLNEDQRKRIREKYALTYRTALHVSGLETHLILSTGLSSGSYKAKSWTQHTFHKPC